MSEREAATWDTVVNTLAHFEHCEADAWRLNTEKMCLHPSVSLLPLPKKNKNFLLFRGIALDGSFIIKQ